MTRIFETAGYISLRSVLVWEEGICPFFFCYFFRFFFGVVMNDTSDTRTHTDSSCNKPFLLPFDDA